MSRKKTEINPDRADNVKKIIKREKKLRGKFTQIQFAKEIHQTQQNVSRIINQQTALTEETARDIIKAFPEYNLEWLLGFSDIMLKKDLVQDTIRRIDATNEATLQILDSAYREVCFRENLEQQTLDNIPELLLLQAQLRDFADALMWNYVKYREQSHVWSYLDQLGDNK